MKVSHQWLRAFVPHTLSAREVGELLSRHVVTLDGLESLRADLGEIVVARVVASERVPDTRLSFNKVDDGSGELLEVICGAPNVAVGALYPFARSGTTLPSGLTIERKKIRGFTSNGMLCSARELNMGDEHDGIMTLDVDVAPGASFLDTLRNEDTRLDLDVLPNRPDLLSHVGIAREIAALTGTALRHPAELPATAAVPLTEGRTEASAHGATVRLAVDSGCTWYVGVVIRGVQVAPSPAWLVRRVESVGGRSINNVVDATNYVLHGFGQPIHAFDLARLEGKSVEVRRARAGERLVTLDGVERVLGPTVVVIADAARPVALAGIMGGRDSEVTSVTTDVLVEVAVFAPRGVRSGRRAVGLSTDASYRFERGIDAGATIEVAKVCASLIASIAGGKIEGALVAGDAPERRVTVNLRHARVNRLLGADVTPAESERLLASIGFGMARVNTESIDVTAPTWRHDVSRDVDLIEEIARLRGYDVLPDDLRAFRLGTVPDHPFVAMGVRVRDVLVGAGAAEARPMPFTNPRGGDAAPRRRVSNPLSEDEPFLRIAVMESLARAAEHNLSQHQGNVRLFEIGNAFVPVAAGGFTEEVRAGLLLMGGRRPAHFTEPRPPAFDEWDAKGIATRMAAAAWPGAAVTLEEAAPHHLWTLRVNDRTVGHVSRVSLDAPVWASPAFGVEITLGVLESAPVAGPGAHNWDESLSAPGRSVVRYSSLPLTPAAEFDLALVVPDAMRAAEVESVLRRAAGDLLESVRLFDEFRGAGVPPGSRSLAWRLTFRHPERTLREKELEGRRAQLLKVLEKELGVFARTT